MSRFRALLALITLGFLASGCFPQGLAFVQDRRLEILSPKDHTQVTLPVTVEWEITDFEITGEDGQATDDAGYFGIFLDAAAVPPGKPLAWIAHNDRTCVNTPGCPDRQYLADRGVYSTTDTSFTIKRLVDQDLLSGFENHEVTIILLDGTGHRIGESAWYVGLLYDRQEEE